MLSTKAEEGKKAFSKRAPKRFIFQASNNGKSWNDLMEVKDAEFTYEKVWRNSPLKYNKKYTFYKIHILANGGDPSLLTIQQIALN